MSTGQIARPASADGTAGTDGSRIRAIAAWLRRLAAGISNPPPPADMAAKCSAIAAACEDVPMRAWCEETLRVGLQTWDFWPASAAVRRMLREWCAENREPRPGIAGAAHHPGLSASAASWVQTWHDRKTRGFALAQGESPPAWPADRSDAPMEQRVREHLASMIRQVCPEAWAAIQQESRDWPEWRDPSADADATLEPWA